MLVSERAQDRAALALALRESGFLVDEASSEAEAIGLAPQVRADLVVLTRSAASERSDGWDVVWRLRAPHQRTSSTPVIGIGPHDERADMERALVAGCDIFVPFPCDPDQVVRNTRALLGMELEAPHLRLASPSLA